MQWHKIIDEHQAGLHIELKCVMTSKSSDFFVSLSTFALPAIFIWPKTRRISMICQSGKASDSTLDFQCSFFIFYIFIFYLSKKTIYQHLVYICLFTEDQVIIYRLLVPFCVQDFLVRLDEFGEISVKLVEISNCTGFI